MFKNNFKYILKISQNYYFIQIFLDLSLELVYMY